jgi:hypothetical protein
VRFCTFEVSTHVGRHHRVGALRDGYIVDVNFATAWYLAQQGEPDPQSLANGLAPSHMLDFLRAGLRSLHAAEELFCESGPPAGWWQRQPAPRGPNDETLVYRPDEVALCAPVPNPARVGTGAKIVCHGEPECELKLAAVIGKQGEDVPSLEARPYIAGYTAMNDFGARLSALGPYLVTPEELDSPYALHASVRVNGTLAGRTHTGTLRSRFEQAIETLSRRDIILPGDVIAFRLDLQPKVERGDMVELEIEGIGTLRTPVA